MAFRTPIKVCFSDIDNAGIVYYPRFMHYFHLAIEEFFSKQLEVDFAESGKKVMLLQVDLISEPEAHVNKLQLH